MKPVRNSISLVVYSRDRSQFLVVLRPDNDRELPHVWGLPAGMVREGESPEDAVRRALKEKLGVEGRAVMLIAEGQTERDDYILEQKLFEAVITNGIPAVPQKAPGVTQYMRLMWGTAKDLKEAESKGSLCCRLYLKHAAAEM